MSIGEKLQIRLEEVTAERDALGRLVHRKSVALQRTEAERDALEAYVEKLHAHIENTDELHPVKWAVRAHKIMQSVPATSIARLKAERQADGADLFADNWSWGEFRPDESDIRKWADELRHQSTDPTQ